MLSFRGSIPSMHIAKILRQYFRVCTVRRSRRSIDEHAQYAHSGIPHSTCELIQSSYSSSRCAMRVEGKLGESFDVITGVNHGCERSFSLWTGSSKEPQQLSTGIQLIWNSQLSDLVLFKDIAPLTDYMENMRTITDLCEEK